MSVPLRASTRHAQPPWGQCAAALHCRPALRPQELVAAVARHSPGLPSALSASPRLAALLAANGELARAVARDDALAAALADDGRWGGGEGRRRGGNSRAGAAGWVGV